MLIAVKCRSRFLALTIRSISRLLKCKNRLETIHFKTISVCAAPNGVQERVLERKGVCGTLVPRFIRSHGSVGRAHRSHRWGHRFESCCDHQKSLEIKHFRGFSFCTNEPCVPHRKRNRGSKKKAPFLFERRCAGYCMCYFAVRISA